MTTAKDQPKGRVRVLLIGDAPAVDKVGKALAEHAEVEVVRNPHKKQIVVRAGFDWVVGMNLQHRGGIVKEAARASGARFLTIPPNWSSAESARRSDGFFVEVARRTAAPLGHRPFAGLADRPATPTPAPEPAAPAIPRAVWVCGAGHAFDHAMPGGCPTCAAARKATEPTLASEPTAAAEPLTVSEAPASKPTRPDRTGLHTGPAGKVSTREERENALDQYVKDHPRATYAQIQTHLRSTFGCTIDSYRVRQSRERFAGYTTNRSQEQVRTRKLLARAVLRENIDLTVDEVVARVKERHGVGISREVVTRTRKVIQRARAWAEKAMKRAAASQVPVSPSPVAPPAPPAVTDPVAATPAPAPATGAGGFTADERSLLDLAKEVLAKANPPYARFSITLRADGRLDVDLARRVVVEHKVTY
jgi:hypothetical protein